MKPFFVLSPGNFFDEKNTSTTIKSFAELFNRVSPKHQKRLKLIFIEEDSHISRLNELLAKERLGNASVIINRFVVEEVEAAYLDASIFLFTGTPNEKIIPEALSFGLPVLTFEDPSLKQYLDNTCSMLVKNSFSNNVHEHFADLLEMLYFDPEVRKLLAKGAISKYNKELSWNT